MEIVTTKADVALNEDYHALNAMVATRDAEGNFRFDKEAEAVRSYFLNHVNTNPVFFHSLKERLKYLFTHKYYDPEVFAPYSEEFLERAYDHAFAARYRFRTFVGAYKFYTAYALKTKDGSRYLERYEHRVVACALMLAQGDENLVIEYIDEILSGRCQPATPTFANAGKLNFGQLVSCFLCICGDNLEDITQQWRNAAQLSKIGGGVGICVTDIREEGAPIKGVADRAAGVIKVAKVLEDIFSYVDQLGTRPGAGIVWIDALHMGAPELLEAKKENVDEKVRLKTLNIGLCMPDIVYEMAALDRDVYLFSSYDIARVTGMPMSQVDMTVWYKKLAADPTVRKVRRNARDYLQMISGIQMESGYPFIMNVDTVNRANNIYGRISQSNLCSEILQVSTHSEFNPDGTYAKVGRDISCNLLSLNVWKSILGHNFSRMVEIAVRMCTAVSDMSDIKWVPSIKHGNDLSHSIGVGAMNLHGAFAGLGIEYGSDIAVEFTDAWFMTLRFHALRASNRIARERGKTFYNFEKSKYATGEAFRYYLRTDYRTFISPQTHALINQFPGFANYIPTPDDWAVLAEDVRLYGLYNQNLLAVAPTGSISYINDSTASIHPVSAQIEKRHEGRLYAYYPAPNLTNTNGHLFKDAFEVGWKGIIDTYAAGQKHVDQGMSCTLSFQEEYTTTREIDRCRAYAWRKGLKTLYYIRARQKSLKALEAAPATECVACSV